MTIVFSSVARNMITMTVDSALTRIVNNEKYEFDTTRKLYMFDGVGCVARWGSLDHNNIGRYFHGLDINPETYDVDKLAHAVDKFLREEYRPHELGLDDLGYHVAGFLNSGEPVIYHVFYGFDRPRRITQKAREYRLESHSNEFLFLYNGRNDLAESVVRLFLDQLQKGGKTRFDLQNREDWILLGDFVARFSAEITPEVGPPFISCVITSSNQVRYIRNDNVAPLGREVVKTLFQN